jgi:hypothetical protein
LKIPRSQIYHKAKKFHSSPKNCPPLPRAISKITKSIQHPQHISANPLQPVTRFRGKPIKLRRPRIGITTENIVTPASCGQAHSTACRSSSLSPNCRLKLSIVFKGSSTGLSKERPIWCRCLPNYTDTFSRITGNSFRILVLTCRYDAESSVFETIPFVQIKRSINADTNRDANPTS